MKLERGYGWLITFSLIDHVGIPHILDSIPMPSPHSYICNSHGLRSYGLGFPTLFLKYVAVVVILSSSSLRLLIQLGWRQFSHFSSWLFSSLRSLFLLSLMEVMSCHGLMEEISAVPHRNGNPTRPRLQPQQSMNLNRGWYWIVDSNVFHTF